MKTLTVVCNVVLVAFTVLLIFGEGLSREVPYLVFTVLLFLIPLCTVLVIVRSAAGWSAGIERAAAVSNLILLGFVAWAMVDRYPHPEEPGFLEYAVLVTLTPILSAVVLFRSAATSSRPRL